MNTQNEGMAYKLLFYVVPFFTIVHVYSGYGRSTSGRDSQGFDEWSRSRQANDGFAQTIQIRTSKPQDSIYFSNYQVVQMEILTGRSYSEGNNSRSKRHDVNNIHIKFHAYGRVFLLSLSKLSRSHGILNEFPIKIIKRSLQGDQELSFDITNYYQGFVEGYSSRVHGSVNDGIFTGVIHITDSRDKVSYYVEPAHRYLTDLDVSSDVVIIYRASDVVPINRTSLTKVRSTNDLGLWIKGGQAFKQFKHNFVLEGRHSLHSTSNDGSVCELQIVIDHTFYQNVGQSDIATTLDEAIFYIMEADTMFRSTDFNGDDQVDNIGFTIVGFTVYTDALEDHYHMREVTSDSEEYLDAISLYNFDSVCLAVSFVHRDFDDGVVGLAWMATSNPHIVSGGICTDQVYTTQGWLSLNTLVVSTFNWGQVMPRAVTAVTTAHEFGHAFGSPHDPEEDVTCAPGGPDGHFIMHPYSTDSDKPNNRHFSSCSTSYIAPVLAGQSSCFRESMGPICGNGIIESGEECDCGSEEHCNSMDPCCTPPNDTLPDAPCTIRRSAGMVCSARSSACCQHDCQVTPASAVRRCHRATDCTEDAYCDGSGADCPSPPQAANLTRCEHATGLCHSGRCSHSVCELYQQQDCQCVGRAEDMCRLCCLDTGQPGPSCRPFTPDGMVLYRSPGRPCNAYTGVCDDQRNCVQGGSDRVNEYLDDNFSSGIAMWIGNNWYYILFSSSLLITVAFIVRRLCRRRGKVGTGAMSEQAANVSVVWQMAADEQTRIAERKATIEATYQERLDALRRSISCPNDAFQRLSYFFPTVPTSTIQDLLRTSSNEEYAVRQLLLRGFPMRRLHEQDLTPVEWHFDTWKIAAIIFRWHLSNVFSWMKIVELRFLFQQNLFLSVQLTM